MNDFLSNDEYPMWQKAAKKIKGNKAFFFYVNKRMFLLTIFGYGVGGMRTKKEDNSNKRQWSFDILKPNKK